MIRVNQLPGRRCMPLEEWPTRDQSAWKAATLEAGLLDDPGLAAHWRPKTKRTIIAAYGRFLTFLSLNGWLDPKVGPSFRITPDHLRAYIDEIKVQVTPMTLSGRIRDLAEALRVMAPGTTYPYLSRARYRLKARARPTKDKRSRMVPSADLLRLGINLMEQAETSQFACKQHRAVRYRDGLIILLLAARPLRRGNMASIKLGHHLTKNGERYQFMFDGSETKNHRPYASTLSPELTFYIDRYIEHFRPILMGSNQCDELWIAFGERPMAYDSLYGIVARHTVEAFGMSISPHLFRDCAITSLGAENPEYVWAGMSLLHHGDSRTTEKHYDQALADHAVHQYQGNLREQRKTLIAAKRRRKRTLLPPQSTLILE